MTSRPVAETISRDRQIDRIHFARMWERRHETPTPLANGHSTDVRASLRDNVRAQRAVIAYERTGRPSMVVVHQGTAEAVVVDGATRRANETFVARRRARQAEYRVRKIRRRDP